MEAADSIEAREHDFMRAVKAADFVLATLHCIAHQQCAGKVGYSFKNFYLNAI